MPNPYAGMNEVGIAGFIMINTAASYHQKTDFVA
jgi:hypothetical protein